MNDLNEASEGIHGFFSTIEGYLTITDVIFLVIFILLIGEYVGAADEKTESKHYTLKETDSFYCTKG